MCGKKDTDLAILGPSSEMKPEEMEEKEHVLRPRKTTTALTIVPTRSTDSISRRWAKIRMVSGSRLPVDTGVRAAREGRHLRRHGNVSSNRKRGRLTIDSGAAESVIPLNMPEEVATKSHRLGRTYGRATSQPTVGGCQTWARSMSSSAQERVSAPASSSR